MTDYRIRDPIHGFVHFDEKERKIIDSIPFQRLKRIKQLAFCYYVYPGAMHTRFEHSLGVMELATRVFDHFCQKDSKKFKDNFKGFIDIKNAKRLLRLAALLHDIGHPPFSHSGEGIFPVGKSHEDASIEIIKNSEIADIIRKEFSRDFVSNIKSLLKSEAPSELRILQQIISGQFDADRMDYLIRDSYHCGVAYGSFDYQRLLETLRLIPDLDSNLGGLNLAIDRGGVHSLEAIILARYFMFAQVYCHRTRRLYDIYLGEFLKNWAGMDFLNNPLEYVLNFDDNVIWLEIENCAKNGSGNKDVESWAKKIFYRCDHHSLIFESNDHADEYVFKDVVNAQKETKEKFPNIRLILDEKAKGDIHKFSQRREGEKEGFDLKVIVDNKPVSLYKESKWLGEGPRKYWCIRVYGYGDEEEVSEARKFFKKKIQNVS